MLTFVALVLGLATQAQAQPPVPKEIAYDVFCGKDRMEKQDLFKTMTAEQKTMLWRTQIERWRDANSARLTADQRQLLAQFQAIIPIAVARPRTAEGDARLEALEARLSSAFSRDQMRAMDNYGPCLPKGK